MCSQKSSEAFSSQGTRRSPDQPLWRQSAPGVWGDEDLALGVWLPLPGSGCHTADHAYQGNHRDTRELRLPAAACTAATGGLERQSQAGVSLPSATWLVAAPSSAKAEQGSLLAATEEAVSRDQRHLEHGFCHRCLVRWSPAADAAHR